MQLIVAMLVSILIVIEFTFEHSRKDISKNIVKFPALKMVRM